MDGTSALHFTLTSENAQASGVVLTGAEGDAKRPAAFSGTLDVSVGPLASSVEIVSVGGTFWASSLLSGGRFKVDQPSKYGFGDPALLLDKDNGLSSLLIEAKNPQLGDQKRLNGEQLQLVTCTLPGARIGQLLTSADPSRDVRATFWINPDSHELREVDLTGPFVAKDHDTTYHLVLTNYGENVTVTPPAQ